MPAHRVTPRLSWLLALGIVPLAGVVTLLGLRTRPRRCTDDHSWQHLDPAVSWHCRRCGEARPHCPHLTWELSVIDRIWQCRACGRQCPFNADGDATAIVGPLLEAQHA